MDQVDADTVLFQRFRHLGRSNRTANGGFEVAVWDASGDLLAGQIVRRTAYSATSFEDAIEKLSKIAPEFLMPRDDESANV